MPNLITTFVARYARGRRGFTRVVTACSVAGILLGVAALIIVMAVMSGFRDELIGRILGIAGHATVEVAGLTTPEATLMAADIKNLKGVTSAVPYISGQVMISANGQAGGAIIRGLNVADIPQSVRSHLLQGTADLQPGDILIGERLAATLRVGVGSGVTLISPQGLRTLMGFVPRIETFRVGGIFKIGMVQFDSGMVLGNMADFQKFLQLDNRVSALEVRVADPEKIEPLGWKIGEVASYRAGSNMAVSVNTWQQQNVDFFRALQVERVTMFIILSLIVIVAAFTIITGQMMLVNDKLADIAILRTMGATRSHIRRIFLMNGLLLGGMGIAGGVLLGVIVVFNMTAVVGGIKAVTGIELFPADVYFLSQLPSRLDGTDMFGIVGMALFLTLLASWYPAWRAAQLDPVELLRRG
ncbi:MAG TPA: lipoprotein-releasing ABC transporter permease subunit [Alphaproteobacteria bacterium]|nr:lipoprotein-releasing ABC transporter permease subunit [Alphaproteobacteria bacterium]